MDGRWVIIDNLHLAPPDMMAVLDSLVSTRKLNMQQRGEVVSAHENFALFATTQTSSADRGNGVEHALPHALLYPWWHVVLPAAEREHQISVLSGRFPTIAALLMPLLAMVHLTRLATELPRGTESVQGLSRGGKTADRAVDFSRDSWPSWTEAIDVAMKDVGLRQGDLNLSLGKSFGMHDIVKVCDRIMELAGSVVSSGLRHMHGANPMRTRQEDVCTLSVDVRRAVLAEVSDVLCGSSFRLVCCSSMS